MVEKTMEFSEKQKLIFLAREKKNNEKKLLYKHMPFIIDAYNRNIKKITKRVLISQKLKIGIKLREYFSTSSCSSLIS